MLKVVNPATEEVIQELPTDTPGDIAHKYALCSEAQKERAEKPVKEKQEDIKRFQALLGANMQHLAETLYDPLGKPHKESEVEIAATADRIDFFLEHCSKVMETEYINTHEGAPEEMITYEPLGVVANISAWNYPYFVGTNVFIPALLTGNAVLYKPSEYATLTGLAIARLLHATGLPHHAFTVVVGGGKQGAEILNQPVDAVFFTGSQHTGLKIMESAAPKLMKVQLELGGKDPAYISDDVDVEKVATDLGRDVFYNAGQSCCAIERLYVHEKIFDNFVDTFTKTAQSLVVAHPKGHDTDMGPLARKAQLETLKNQVNDATKKGATILCGGKKLGGKGNYFPPTVLVDVNHNMTVMKHETFGPIIGIQKVANDTEAINLMNDTDYGLTAAVFCHDKNRASTILKTINAGTVYWNCCDRVSPQLPWTGRKLSGVGATLSQEGIRAFLQPKAWHLKPPAPV